MADSKISALTELTVGNVADTDELVIVDKSDTTMAASGTDKRALASTLRDYTSFSAPTVSGWYYGAMQSQYSNVICGEGEIRGYPFPVWRRTAYDRIAAEVVTVGTTGAVARLGAWTRSGTLVADAGTIVGDSGTGWKEITISWTLNPGVYILAAVPQGGAGTRVELRAGTLPTGLGCWLLGGTNRDNAVDNLIKCVTCNAQTGALTNLASVGTSNSALPPDVVLRAV